MGLSQVQYACIPDFYFHIIGAGKKAAWTHGIRMLLRLLNHRDIPDVPRKRHSNTCML
jgi:hypothetical protein